DESAARVGLAIIEGRAGLRDDSVSHRSRDAGREIEKVKPVRHRANNAAFFADRERADGLRCLPLFDVVAFGIEAVDGRRVPIDPVERLLARVPYRALAQLILDVADFFDCDCHRWSPRPFL